MSATDQLSVSLPPRRRSGAALVTARPLQWVKNALVIAAAGAAGALGRDDVPVRVGLAALAFCLLSSGIYALNDVRDAAEDRLHPRKRFRPVAAGELSPRDAVLLGAGCLTAGMVLCAAIRPLLAVVGAAYLALTLSYTWLWRRILVLDIVAIAGGFVLRALAGGVAAPVGLSRWFVLVVTGASLFVAAGKRQAELVRTAGKRDPELLRTDGKRDPELLRTAGKRDPELLRTAGKRDPELLRIAGKRHAEPVRAGDGQIAPERAVWAGDVPPTPARRVISGYSPGILQLLLAGSGAIALSAYWVWAFALVDIDGVPWRMLTAIPFTVGLLRYGALVRTGVGEAPEETLLSDQVLLLSAMLWLLLFALNVHAAG